MEKRPTSKKMLLSLGMVAMVTLLTVSMVFAYQGDYTVNGPNYSDERHEAMEEAFENLDYSAWYDLMTEDGRHPRIVDVITADNFAKFAEAHELADSGDLEGANVIRSELGLYNGQGPKDGTGYKNGLSSGQGRGTGQGSSTGLRGQGYNGNCPYQTSN